MRPLHIRLQRLHEPRFDQKSSLFRFTVCGFALICATSIIGKLLTRNKRKDGTRREIQKGREGKAKRQKVQDCGTARKGNLRSASGGNTGVAEEYRRRNRETPSPFQEGKRTELRAGSAPCLLYRRATQKLGNPGR